MRILSTSTYNKKGGGGENKKVHYNKDKNNDTNNCTRYNPDIGLFKVSDLQGVGGKVTKLRSPIKKHKYTRN